MSDVIDEHGVTPERLEQGEVVIHTIAEAAELALDVAEVATWGTVALAGLSFVAMMFGAIYDGEEHYRAKKAQGLCYGVMYTALEMGAPSYPHDDGAWGGASSEEDAEKQLKEEEDNFWAGFAVGQATTLVPGNRNRILVRTASAHSSEASGMLNELWDHAKEQNAVGSGSPYSVMKLTWSGVGFN